MPVAQNGPAPALESPLPSGILHSLYGTMLKAKLLSAKLRDRQRISGAILAGTIANLESGDVVVSSAESPLLDRLVQDQLSLHSENAAPAKKVVAAGAQSFAALACGIATICQQESEQSRVVVTLASGFSRGPAWDEAVAIARDRSLPVIFITDWTDRRLPTVRNEKKRPAYPLPVITVDGRDVIAMYRVAKEAIQAARKGHGPTLVECIDYVAPGGRGRDLRDPLKSFRGYLERHNGWDEQWASELRAQIEQQLRKLTSSRTKKKR